jgi:hypothetical protein
MKRPNRKDYINRHTPIKLIADLERYIDHLENTLQDNEPQERVDKLGTNTPDKSKTYISPSTEMIAAFVNDEWMQFHRSDTIQDNGLREAAEKVVYEWHNSIGEECIDAAMVELVKVLNSKKQ